jgi:hypothetical protein
LTVDFPPRDGVLGAPFAAFGDDSLRARWLGGGSDADLDGGRRHRLEDALTEVRERGYAVWRDSEAREELGQKLRLPDDEPSNTGLRREVVALLRDLSEGFVAVNLDSTNLFNIANVTAPVFSSSGEVMILTGIGFAAPLDGAGVANVGARLKASAQVIAMRTFGSSAQPDGARERASHRLGRATSKETQR